MSKHFKLVIYLAEQLFVLSTTFFVLVFWGNKQLGGVKIFASDYFSPSTF